MDKSVKKRGFTIGKFAPFHMGHRYLIETGLKMMDEFYVVIYDTPDYDIEMKEKWIRSEFPGVKILRAYDSPKRYGLDEVSVNIQMEYLLEVIKGLEFTHFFSSEEYGRCVADYLGIESFIVDMARRKYKISGSEVRKNIEENKQYLSKMVYDDIRDD